ncbi:hypothetical protein C8F01DRAFT_1001134 [Mycena amicta]|nr:hypothetical protein C8F01DRAFT_1001134 [Mycena amicta]
MGSRRKCVLRALLLLHHSNSYSQVLSIAADNASPNDVMMEELLQMLPETARLSPATRIRCLAHILNLVVKVRHRLFHGLYAHNV